MVYTVATFYKFVSLPDAEALRLCLRRRCQAQDVRGTILLAPEGINGTLAGTAAALDAVLADIRQDQRLADLEIKYSTAAAMPFDRLKVRLKAEIVTLGRPEADPNQRVGTYVEPQDWNALIADPEVLVIDTRNDYEVRIGSFANAVNPQTQSFREFPDYVQQLDPQRHRKVALFCTGGIRCEKASALLLAQGFPEVYHLKGGILRYLEQVPAADSQWQGECYVFDQRVALQQGLTLGSHGSCLSCGVPISAADQASPDYEYGVSCPHCVAGLTPEKRDRQRRKRLQPPPP
jgi:UPF0176 protein